MQYYYRYIFTNQNLKTFEVWNYSKEIISALKTIYSSDLVEVEFSSSHYGFWLNRKKGQYEHNNVGKLIANSVSDFNNNKSIYTFNPSNSDTVGVSTQIFKEDKNFRNTR